MTKIIHVYWAASKDEVRQSNWLFNSHSLISQVLSSLLLIEKHGEAELLTNQEGKTLLIDILKIPYKKYKVAKEGTSPTANILNILQKTSTSVTIIQPDIYVFNKINTSSDKKIHFLSRDLNSIKLIDAVVKIKRQCGTLPRYINLPNWVDKQSYINNNVITIKDAGLFKKFALQSKSYLNKNETRLACLKQDVIENFIFRYFLLGYCIDNKLEYNILIDKDHLYLDQRDILFSKENISNGYIQIDGNQKNNIETIKQVFQYFENTYPAYFNSLMNYLNHNNINIAKTPKPFQRVIQLCIIKAIDKIKVHEIIKKHIENLSPARLKKELKSFGFKSNIKLLNDLIKYETKLHLIYNLLSSEEENINNYQSTLGKKIIAYKSMDLEEKLLQIIEISSYAFFHVSNWKWSTNWQVQVDEARLAELKVLYNFNLQPSYNITAFVINAQMKHVFEYSLNKMSVIIINFTSTKVRISQVIKYFSDNKYDFKNLNQSEEEFENYVLSTIEELIYLHILKFV